MSVGSFLKKTIVSPIEQSFGGGFNINKDDFRINRHSIDDEYKNLIGAGGSPQYKIAANPFEPQINQAQSQIDRSTALYNPYIESGRNALGLYQALYQKPLDYQYSPTQGQQFQLNQVNADIGNQQTIGSEQIDANAAVSGGLFGGNRIRAQGELASDLVQNRNTMTQGLNDQFYQQGYESAVDARDTELQGYLNTAQQGQQASQALGQTTSDMYGIIGQLRQQYGDQEAQRILAHAQARDAERSQQLNTGVGLLSAAAGLF